MALYLYFWAFQTEAVTVFYITLIIAPVLENVARPGAFNGVNTVHGDLQVLIIGE